MLDKMKELMEMKRQADELKKELDASSVEVADVRGITLTINGSQYIQAVTLEEAMLSPANKKRLESDLLRAFNTAVKRSQELAAKKMRSMPGFNLPGFS